MKILVISLAGIGDTLLATPLLQELRANYPQAQIDALVLWAGSKDLLEGNPHLNRVFQRNLLKSSKMESLRFLAPLRHARYDVSLNTHPQSRTHYRVTARFIAASTRISHEYENFGLLDRFLVNRTLPQDYQKHTVENNLALLDLLGAQIRLPNHTLEVALSSADQAWAEAFLRNHELTGKQRLGLHAGSGGTKNLKLKRWPLRRYIEFLQQVRQSWPELAVLLFGVPEEEPELERIRAEVTGLRLIRVRSQTLRQAGALMQRCTAFLSVDTALMHLAAAVRAPGQIVIEAPTLNKTNEPYGNPFELVPNPAVAGKNLDFYRYAGAGIKGSQEELIRCMESVTPEALLEKLAKVLKESC